MLTRFFNLFPFMFAPDAGTGSGEPGGPDGGTADADIETIAAAAQNPDAVKAALMAERAAVRAARDELAELKKAGGTAGSDAARTAAESAARAARKEADELKARLAEFEDANKSETEKLIEKARKDAEEATRDEVTKAYEQRLLEGRLIARAAGKLADASDATSLIKLDDLAKSESGEVDDKTIDAAIATLIKQKPYLATGATPGPGSADGGPRGTRPSQLTREDLKGMSPEAIVEAKAKGQLDEVLSRT